MNTWIIVISSILGFALLAVLLLKYLRYRSNIQRSYNMVFLRIRVPKKESKEDREVEGEQYSSQMDFKEMTGGIMSQFFESLYSIHSSRLKSVFTDQEFLSLEYAVIDSRVHFYIVCPENLVSLIEKQLTAFYPDSYVEQVDDYNIFKPVIIFIIIVN